MRKLEVEAEVEKRALMSLFLVLWEFLRFRGHKHLNEKKIFEKKY